MKQSKRLLTVIITFCFIIGYFLPIQSYALSNTATKDNSTNNEVIQTQNPLDDEEDIDVTITGAAIDCTTTKPAISTTTASGIDVKDEDDTNNEELWYKKQNPMKKDHQKLLWEYCKKRNINYIDMLALIYTESNFDEKCSIGKCFGYFQISSGNCANLAVTLKTKNKPLDGAININWGTYIYSGILADKRVKGLEGTKKRDVALSIFQRGTGGYDKYGISTKFLKVFYKKRAKVSAWFEIEK